MTSNPNRVLVVEDQRLVAADLEDTLKRLGYEVAGNVATGEEAIAAAIATLPDLALMDIRLRGAMDGIEAATAIRARMDIPIIYLTAYADEETVRRAKVTSPFGYLVKPFNERELRAAIDVGIYKHRTERLLAEERARREVAEEFKLLVEGVQDYAIYLLDAAGRVATWNAGAERIKGYAPDEIIGRHFSAFFPAEDIAAGKPQAELNAASQHARAEDEGWRLRRDGSRFWANVVVTALRDEQGALRGFAKITRDMTARRATELELEESVARMRAMTMAALDCIISMDAAGRVTDWNPAAEETFGYARSEAIGRELSELIIPERLRKKHRAGLKRYLRTGVGPIVGRRVEMPASTKHRGEIVVELSIVKVVSGESPTFTGFLRDVTARKRAEAERASQEQAQLLLDRTTVALASSLEISQTLEQAARFAVPQLADWCLIDLANDAGELCQMACAHVDAQAVERARRLGRECIPDPNLDHGAHHVFRTGKSELHPDLDDVNWTAQLLGTEYPELLRDLGIVSYLCVPVRFRGQTRGVLNLLRTAPGRRYTGRDLWLAEEVARRIGLAVDNARLFHDAQDAIRARDEFLQIASHELKTPLTPLQLQLDTLTRALERAEPQNARILARVETAIRQTDRLGRLVESLLDVSRITAGKLTLDPEIFDLAELVRDLAERYQAEATKAGSQIKVSADEPVVGHWDRSRIEQVIANLLSNAIKYGAKRPIEIETLSSDGTARVVVKDRGIGIEKSGLERIFGRFERGVSFRHYGGLGLGLFIAQQFAEAHGGTIVAQSELGAGATFTLVLPRSPDRALRRNVRNDQEVER